MKLAAQLDLGNPSDEATAEDILTVAGVVPTNGWISDYPMTPQIIGQLKEAISRSAAEGKLPLNADEAIRGLYSLTAQLNLPTPAEPGSQTTERFGQGPATPPNPAVVNNYYYDQGPPVVTYYPPPYDYGYLYAWVPYPTFWFGFWFPGFYICHSFTTVVVSPVFVNRRVIVTNHVIDPVTRRVAIVDPVTRTSNGVRPATLLRTDDGRTFRNLPEMRRATGSLVPKGPESRTVPGTYRGAGLKSQKSAESIYRKSVERDRSGTTGRFSSRDDRFGSHNNAAGPANNERGRYSAPVPAGRSYHDPSVKAGRPAAPRIPGKAYNAPARSKAEGGRHSYTPSPPDRSYGSRGSWQGRSRSFDTPGTPERTFNAPMKRGSGGRDATSLFRGKWEGR
jgi:hypothetical protein